MFSCTKVSHNAGEEGVALNVTFISFLTDVIHFSLFFPIYQVVEIQQQIEHKNNICYGVKRVHNDNIGCASITAVGLVWTLKQTEKCFHSATEPQSYTFQGNQPTNGLFITVSAY